MQCAASSVVYGPGETPRMFRYTLVGVLGNLSRQRCLVLLFSTMTPVDQYISWFGLRGNLLHVALAEKFDFAHATGVHVAHALAPF